MDECFLGSYEFSDDEYNPTMEENVPGLTTSEINQWASWIKPFPLPSHMVPVGTVDWSAVDDETIMNTPPHLIAHIQRTAAQGGLQIVSPRQTPISCLMGRVSDSKREVADHVVGSVACPDDSWPTLDDADMERWLPDEPLPDPYRKTYLREKTRTEPLTSAGHLLRDPILGCLVKGRAVVDITRRDDVAGDADGLSELLAAAWGVETQEFMEMDAYTLGIDGPLLRHAIKADEVYPMVHAPVHQKMCVGVSNVEVTRDLLPEHAAMDWRRMRVFCEAVFIMSCTIEGIPLKSVRCSPPPGDPTAPLTRKNILAFRPLPCSAWSCDPAGFSIVPVFEKKPFVSHVIPRDVMSAMSRYLSDVKPMSHAMSVGHRAVAKKSTIVEVDPPEGETIRSAYDTVVSKVTTGGARGKTAAATVRNVIYETLESAPLEVRLRLCRYLHIASAESLVHLGSTMPTDSMIDRLATKFLKIGETIRVKIVAESARRGSNSEEWWADIVSQAPLRYKYMREGTSGWARVGMWLAFKEPTAKWSSLSKALHFTALRDASMAAVSGVALPSKRGSKERILEAARAIVRKTSSAYSSYYMAVADVAHSIADELDAVGRPRSSEVIREAAYLWVLRARALRGTNVHPLSKEAEQPSVNHLRVSGAKFDLIIVPTPYRAFEAYRTHVSESKLVNAVARKQLMEYDGYKISDVFPNLQSPLIPAKESTITRFLLKPGLLRDALEKAWRELAIDVTKAIQLYALEVDREPILKRTVEVDGLSAIPLDWFRPKKTNQKPGLSYIDCLADMETDEVDWFEDMLERMDPATAGVLQERHYTDLSEIRSEFLKVEEAMERSARFEHETVK